MQRRWPQSIAQGPRTQLSRPRDIMHASWAGDFFFFFFCGSADPRIFEDSNGSSADPDRSGFRWIRFTPTVDYTVWCTHFSEYANAMPLPLAQGYRYLIIIERYIYLGVQYVLWGHSCKGNPSGVRGQRGDRKIQGRQKKCHDWGSNPGFRNWPPAP